MGWKWFVFKGGSGETRRGGRFSELREWEVVGGERDGGVCEARGVRWIAGGLSLCRFFGVSHDPAVTVACGKGRLQVVVGVRNFLVVEA